MLIVCAWCKTEIGEHKGVKKEEISHGICLPCAFKESPEAAVRIWIKKHPQDVAAAVVAILAGIFLVYWFMYGAPPVCAP